jgi:beta-N-acetylhexosaminidase
VKRTVPVLVLAALLASACSPAPRPSASAASAGAPADAIRDEPPPARAEPAPAARPDPLRLDAEAEAWVERTLAGMTVRQRVAQLVMPWISGASPSADAVELQRTLGWVGSGEVGGLIVSRGTPPALAAKLNAAQARARVPLLVVSDLETGPGMRLTGGTDFPPAMAFGAADDLALAREAGRVTGIEARAVGIHMTLGPVLDVNSNPRNPIINVRSFGERPELVARLANAWIEGARESGLLAAGKHFPGHGDTEVDSHVGLAAIRGDAARLEALELVPFAAAIDAGMAGMLVGHIALTGVEGADAPPASLSPWAIDALLRRRLGFEGLVFTDALNMGAVTRHYRVAEASIRALLAGADVLLQPPGTEEVIAEIVRAVESGRVPRARIDEAARRVLATKAALGLHRGDARVDAGAVAGRVGTASHRAAAQRVADASITVVRNRGEVLPIRRPGTRVLHVAYSRASGGGAGSGVSRQLEGGGLRVEHAPVHAQTGRAEFERLRARAAAADVVIASASIAPHEYRTLGLEGGFGAFVEALAAAGRPVVAVSLGSPYLLEDFPSVPAYVAGWSAAAASQRSLARVLLGELDARGRAPVSLGAP